MELQFYQFWNLMFNIPKFPLKPDEAKKWHEEEKPYVVVVLEEGKMKYVVKVNFEIIYCSVYYLNANCERVKSEAYTENEGGLFLLDRKVWKHRPHNDMDVYAFKLDGSYVKSHVDEQGYITDRIEGTCDVSTHFREMIRFGYYDPILPEGRIG